MIAQRFSQSIRNQDWANRRFLGEDANCVMRIRNSLLNAQAQGLAYLDILEDLLRPEITRAIEALDDSLQNRQTGVN